MLKRTPGQSEGSKKFKYRDTGEDTYRERAEQSTGAFSDSIFKKGFDVYRAKQGENCIRILPRTWDEPNHFGYDVYVHGFVGVNRGSYLCLAQMKNKPCPICNVANEMAARGEEQESYKMKAKRRVIYWVIDRNAERGKKPWPMLFNSSPTMDRDIMAMTRTRRGRVEIHRPDDGRDVVFSRKGQTVTNTEYFGYQLDSEPTPVNEDPKTQSAILNFIENNPVPECLLFQKADYLQQVIAGTAEEEDPDLDDKQEDVDDEEDNEAQEAAQHVKPKKAKAKVEEDDDEDLDEDDDTSPPWQGKGNGDEDDDGEDQDQADDDEEDYEDEEEPEKETARAPKRAALTKRR